LSLLEIEKKFAEWITEASQKTCAFCGQKFEPRTETRPGAFDPEIYCSPDCTVHAQEAE
jgi:hypothetical protein